MSIIIEATPDHPKLFEEGSEAVSTPETDLAWKLQSAYHQRFAFYERQMAEALNLLESLSPRLAPSYFPKVSVVFDDEEEEIVFDFSLYESLLETYVFEGWEGISQIEQALDMHLPQSVEDAPSAGTPANARTLWLPVRTFFRFTRNLLALLIRDTLVGIERKAASAITAGLSRSAILIAKAWQADFQIVRDYRSEYVPLPEGHYVTRAFYRCKNRGMSNALFTALSEAVRQKFAYEETLKRGVGFSKATKTIKGYLQRTKERAQPQEEQRLDEDLAQLDLGQEEVERLTKQSEEFLKGILSVIHLNCPLGLIVLDGLSVGFTQEAMEQKLGEALWEMYEKIDEIGRGVDPQSSRVLAMPAPATGNLIAWDTVQRWEPPGTGVERFVVKTAIERLADDPGWFPLAHQETWHQLMESGMVARDSFEYIVFYHYVSALIDHIETIQENEESSKKFWKSFGRIAAALSLASLATPATAEFAPLLRGVSTVADLAAMAHAIYSATSNLAWLSQLLAEELVHPNAFALEHLARIGELAQIRREALDQMTTQVLMELGLTVAGEKLSVVKKLLLARGYYFDLETLLDDEGDNGN